MVGAFHAVGIETRFEHNLHVTASAVAITVDDAPFHVVGNGGSHHFVHIAGIVHGRVCQQFVNDTLFDAVVVEMLLADSGDIEEHLIIGSSVKCVDACRVERIALT